MSEIRDAIFLLMDVDGENVVTMLSNSGRDPNLKSRGGWLVPLIIVGVLLCNVV